MSRSSPSTYLAFAAAVLALGACSAPPPPFESPPLELSVGNYAGTVINGVSSTPLPDDAPIDDALRLRCTLTYLERLPDEDLPLLTGHTRLLIAAEGGRPIQVANDLLERSRLLPVADVERFAELRTAGKFGRVIDVHEWNEVLPHGVTTAFTAEQPDAARAGAKLRAGVCVSRALGSDVPTIALVIEQPGSDSAERRVDLIVLDVAPDVGGEGVELLFPSPFAGPDGAGFAARVELLPPLSADADAAETAEHAAALERCGDRMSAAARDATARSLALDPNEVSLHELRWALGGLNQERLQRPVLVFIAGATGATLTQDLALGADDAALEGFTQDLAAVGVTASAAAVVDGSDATRLGFTLECVAFRWLGRLASDGKLDPDLEGVLLRHAGAAGRFPGTIADLVASSSDLADLSRRIEAENLTFLEDPDPASRVRAFDWLTLRQRVPEGYAPLAPAAERRAALKRAAAADTAESVAPAPPSGSTP